MNKNELISAMADKAEVSAKVAGCVFGAMVDVIIAELKKGEKITVPGFGVFEAKARAARAGINPKTGEKIKIAASVSPSFKAGKGLKDALN